MKYASPDRYVGKSGTARRSSLAKSYYRQQKGIRNANGRKKRMPKRAPVNAAPASVKAAKLVNSNEARLTNEERQALSENRFALASANSQADSTSISDIQTLHGEDLKVPYIADGSVGLYTEPRLENDASQILSGSQLQGANNNLGSFDKAFIVFQTAKGSDDNTYDHAISYDSRYIGWINASSMHRIKLRNIAIESKGEYCK